MLHEFRFLDAVDNILFGCMSKFYRRKLCGIQFWINFEFSLLNWMNVGFEICFQMEGNYWYCFVVSISHHQIFAFCYFLFRGSRFKNLGWANLLKYFDLFRICFPKICLEWFCPFLGGRQAQEKSWLCFVRNCLRYLFYFHLYFQKFG